MLNPGYRVITKKKKLAAPPVNEYDPILCPICGKLLGEWHVKGSAVFSKRPCPRCKKEVKIEKKT